jgi:hypothetical protein
LNIPHAKEENMAASDLRAQIWAARMIDELRAAPTLSAVDRPTPTHRDLIPVPERPARYRFCARDSRAGVLYDFRAAGNRSCSEEPETLQWGIFDSQGNECEFTFDSRNPHSFGRRLRFHSTLSTAIGKYA